MDQLAQRAKQLLKKQEMGKQEAPIKRTLARFARGVAKQRARNAARATSVPAAKEKDYDDILEQVEDKAVNLEDMDTQLRKKKIQVPIGAFVTRQRLDSVGRAQRRFGGQAIRV